MHFQTKLTKKSKKWRGALIYLALFGVAPIAFGAETETRYVSNYAGLKAAIAEYNGNTGADFKIVLTNGITLEGELPAITGNASLIGKDSGSLTIEGSGYAINGAGQYRGLYIDGADADITVSVSGVTFANCYAKGGDGGEGKSGGGGGLGAGAAIYAFSGNVVLTDVTAANSVAVGGDGGGLLYGSESYGAGGGLGGDGGSGKLLESGAASGGGVFVNGSDSSPEKLAGDGGVASTTDLNSYAHTIPGTTTPVGGNSLAGGGGGASTAYGGAGGFAGGGGAGGTQGGEGGFGGGGAGGSSAITAGTGGFGAGDGGYVDEVVSSQFSNTPGGGVGGGGAALGAAIFVGSAANVTVAVSDSGFGEMYGGSLIAGQGGGGTAENGEAIGKGVFLLNDLTIQVAEGGKYVVSDSIGGYAGSKDVAPDENGNYLNTSGIVKTGSGTLVLNAGDSSYTGDTTVKGGSLVANTTGSISSYSSLNVESGDVELNADQTVRNLNGTNGATVDLNNNALTITGDGDNGIYAGKFEGNGTLVKNGTSSLALAGDSRGSNFNTVLNGGTIQVKNDGAFGDGTVTYSRSNPNDQTSSIEFDDGIKLANDIVLSGNSNPLILSGGSAELSGRIVAKPGSNGDIVLRLEDGKSIHILNTGVTTDEDGNIVETGGNSFGSITFESGNAVIDVDSVADGSGRYWYNSLGNSDIISNDDTTLSFILDTDDPGAGLRFSNNIISNSGWVTVDPVTLKDTTDQVQNIYAEGNVSGAGGFRLDIGAGATYNVLGSYGVAKTDVNTGVLNVANVKDSAAFVGALTSSGAGTVDSGSKDLVVSFNNESLAYNGKIVGDDSGANVYKTGSGKWTLNLTNDSKVNLVNVTEGTLSLGANHFDSGMYPSNDFGVVVGPNGVFEHSTTSGEKLVLNNFDATRGGAIVVGANDELVLSNKNTATELAANLNGSGTISLENVVDSEGAVTPWVISGNNSNWSGNISATDPYANVVLASQNAGSANSSMSFGSFGQLDVAESTVLGAFDFVDNATINAAPGKTLTLNSLTSDPFWLDDSVFTIDGGGTVALNENAATGYYGATAVKGGSTLALLGDNTADPSVRHKLTLTEGGTLKMDYSGVSSSNPLNSYWGSEIDVDGDGGITVVGTASNGPVVMNETIGFVGADPGTLTFNTTNSNVELRSVIDGSGSLVKTGNGSLILNGGGAFADANVKQGVLQLGTDAGNYNDQLAYANLLVNGGDVTGWTNKLGTVGLNSGSLHLSSPGTVSLTGSGDVFSMNGGSLYVDVVDKTNYTSFQAEDPGATAHMNGGSIYVDTDTYGADLSVGDSLTVVEVDPGNMTANPSNFTIYDDYAGMRFVVDSSKLADGYFNLLLKKNSFAEYARTPNQRSVAQYLDQWQDGPAWDAAYSDMFASLENAVESDPRFLDQMTGELRFSAMNAQIQSRNLMRQTLTRAVLPSPTYTGCTGFTSCCSAIRGQEWVYGQEETGLSGWASAFGAGGEASDRHGTSGFDYSLLGGMFGVEIGSTATNQFGFYYSYSNTEVDGGYMGNVAVHDNIFGLYLRLSDDWGYTLATGSFGVSDYESDRTLAVGRNYYDGSTDGWSGSAYLERGINFCMPASLLQPYGGLQYTHLRMDAFTESGTYNAFALRTTDTEYNSLQGVLGVRWLKSLPLATGAFDFNIYANWTHEFLDDSVEGDLTMVAGPNNTFHIVGNGVGRDWVYAGLGGDWLLSQNFDVFGGADVQVNEYTSYVNGNAGFRIKW